MTARNVNTIFKRESRSYFNSPVAGVFLVAFLVLVGFSPSVCISMRQCQASLDRFFMWHPGLSLAGPRQYHEPMGRSTP